MTLPRTAWLTALAVGLVAILPMQPAAAVDWESLVMPGPVIAGHRETEKECRKCHAPFARDQQRALCLDCHDAVAADMDGKRGFHGRSEPARTSQCRNCHTEHEGRDADIVRLTPQTFDHAVTDFALEGGHRSVPCAGCHEPAVKHRDAKAACNDCHAEDDVHETRLGEDCASCHDAGSWKQTRFDHAKAGDPPWPLTGKHAKVVCELCHAGQRFADTPTDCAACHRIDDVHQGQRGTACADCHDTDAWKEPTFDHLRKTGFGLTAGHGGLACAACHQGGNPKKVAGKQCVDCHRSDDAHQGRNGTQCQDCHATRVWDEVRFDHGARTEFALHGAHAELTCVACHKGVAAREKLTTTCVACHRADDPHRESLGTDCGACHNERKWADAVRFDHDLAKFPLAGLHATASCESCHLDKRYAGTPSACVDCHRADDVHEGGLGEHCADCHTPNDWRIWRFDHDTQTHFVIDGAHDGLTCIACHQRAPGQGRAMARDCGSCHRSDDVHDGQFGSDCSRCHDTRTFRGARRNTR
ncbi:MAG: cytochrome C [Gammaproteobacteria bacterium]|nr:cytochrome C [Gammaproteobacteria bacterium]